MEQTSLELGRVVPALASKPSLRSFEVDVWNAFARLSARRNVSGFGAVGAIPYIEIASYLDIVLRLEDQEDRDLFIELVECLDNLFLKDYADKQRKEQQSKTVPQKPKLILPN